MLVMSLNTCSLSEANWGESYSQLHTEWHWGMSYMWTHTNSMLQGKTKMWRGTRSSLRTSGARLHMSVTHSCCQDQHHHLMGKRGHATKRCKYVKIDTQPLKGLPCGSIYSYVCVWLCGGIMCYFTWHDVRLCALPENSLSLSQQATLWNKTPATSILYYSQNNSPKLHLFTSNKAI